MVSATRKPIFPAAFLLATLTCLLAACAPTAPALPPTNQPPTASPAPTVSPECTPGSHTNHLLSAARERTYLLHVPASYHAGQPVPLVLGFHGNTGHADGYEAYTGFSTVSEQAGFIIAYAQGAGSPPTWDTWQGSKDVRYTSDLIDRLETICSIDSARVYATGFSLGGGMVDRLACDLSGRIAAVGAVSGAYINSQPCSPTQPVAVIAMHGTADSEVFYNGMPPAGTTPQTYFSISQPIPQWAQEWAQRNGCSEKASIFFRQDPVSGQRWDRCATGADVIFYTIRDGPHAWPDRTAGFIAEQIIWDFFSSHPLVRSSDFSRSPGSIQANSLP